MVTLVCTACGKRFANRWAYNQHRTNRIEQILGRDRLLFFAETAIRTDCNQKRKHLHRCSPLIRSIAIRQANDITYFSFIWTYLYLYGLPLSNLHFLNSKCIFLQMVHIEKGPTHMWVGPFLICIICKKNAYYSIL